MLYSNLYNTHTYTMIPCYTANAIQCAVYHTSFAVQNLDCYITFENVLQHLPRCHMSLLSASLPCPLTLLSCSTEDIPVPPSRSTVTEAAQL